MVWQKVAAQGATGNSVVLGKDGCDEVACRREACIAPTKHDRHVAMVARRLGGGR